MTPVKQSQLYAEDGIGNGDCFAAALASLLDIPLWMVPPFHQMFGRRGNVWRERAEEWLRRFFSVDLVRTEGDLAGCFSFYIANGPSSRGVHHSCIYFDGQLVHDPHPSNEGITAVEWCYRLEKRS